MLAAHECGLEGLQRSCSIRLGSARHLDRCLSLISAKRQYMHHCKCAVRISLQDVHPLFKAAN